MQIYIYNKISCFLYGKYNTVLFYPEMFLWDSFFKHKIQIKRRMKFRIQEDGAVKKWAWRKRDRYYFKLFVLSVECFSSYKSWSVCYSHSFSAEHLIWLFQLTNVCVCVFCVSVCLGVCNLGVQQRWVKWPQSYITVWVTMSKLDKALFETLK